MDTTDSSLIFYGVAVIVGLIWAAGMVLLLALAWQLLVDWFTRDRSQPYWRHQRGPVGPHTGGRRR